MRCSPNPSGDHAHRPGWLWQILRVSPPPHALAGGPRRWQASGCRGHRSPAGAHGLGAGRRPEEGHQGPEREGTCLRPSCPDQCPLGPPPCASPHAQSPGLPSPLSLPSAPRSTGSTAGLPPAPALRREGVPMAPLPPHTLSSLAAHLPRDSERQMPPCTAVLEVRRPSASQVRGSHEAGLRRGTHPDGPWAGEQGGGGNGRCKGSPTQGSSGPHTGRQESAAL